MKEKLWCCVGYNCKEPYYNWQSLSYTRTASIGKHTGDWTWEKWKRKGWKCIRVEISIEPIITEI